MAPAADRTSCASRYRCWHSGHLVMFDGPAPRCRPRVGRAKLLQHANQPSCRGGLVLGTIAVWRWFTRRGDQLRHHAWPRFTVCHRYLQWSGVDACGSLMHRRPVQPRCRSSPMTRGGVPNRMVTLPAVLAPPAHPPRRQSSMVVGGSRRWWYHLAESCREGSNPAGVSVAPCWHCGKSQLGAKGLSVRLPGLGAVPVLDIRPSWFPIHPRFR